MEILNEVWKGKRGAQLNVFCIVGETPQRFRRSMLLNLRRLPRQEDIQKDLQESKQKSYLIDINSGVDELCGLVRSPSKLVEEHDVVPDILQTTLCDPEFRPLNGVSLEEATENWINSDEDPFHLDSIFEEEIKLHLSTPQPPQHSVTPITNAISAFDDKQQSLTMASPAEGLPAPTTEDVEVALSTIHRYASYLQNETLRLGRGLDQGDPIAEFERLNRRILWFEA